MKSSTAASGTFKANDQPLGPHIISASAADTTQGTGSSIKPADQKPGPHLKTAPKRTAKPAPKSKKR